MVALQQDGLEEEISFQFKENKLEFLMTRKVTEGVLRALIMLNDNPDFYPPIEIQIASTHQNSLTVVFKNFREYRWDSQDYREVFAMIMGVIKNQLFHNQPVEVTGKIPDPDKWWEDRNY